MSRSVLLTYVLLAGAILFGCMATAHWLGFKYPILFVYYDVPSHPYQDKIIGFCCIGFASVFYTAAYHRATLGAAISCLLAAVVGLSAVNMSSDLRSMIGSRSTMPYWIQTGIIASYLLLLVFLSSAQKKKKN